MDSLKKNSIDYFSRLAKKAVDDEEAFTELYENFFPRVYNVVFAKVKNPTVADDIVSEIFTKVFLNLRSYNEKFAFSTWIFTIARNSVTDYFRRAVRQKEDSWEDFFNVESSISEQPEEKFLAAELNEELLRALGQLNERQQRIMGLRYFGGLKNKEIAEVTGLSLSNVGFIQHQALNKLREIFKKQ